jgi:hypothetical protein
VSLDDETLMAFADGELDPARHAEVEAAVAASPELAARLERQRRLKARLEVAFAPVLDEPVPEQLMAAVRGQGGAEVVALAGRRPQRPAPPRTAWTAMAACLVVGIAAGLSLETLRPQPWIRTGPGGPEASGALGRALDGELASAGQAGPVRTGLSFLAADGRYCRTFTSARRLAGLACRDQRGWRLQLLQATQGEAQGPYRMAASETPPQVLQAAQAMMAGAPLDARGEAAAKARGWRR